MCRTCSNSEYCNSCNSIDSIKLYYDGLCYDVCPSGTYNKGLSCFDCDNNCKECMQDSCTLCHDNKVLLDGMCIDKCPEHLYVQIEN